MTNELITKMCISLYKWVTLRQSAQWEGKRPGLCMPALEGMKTASCGAFREWGIFAHDGLVAFAADGYRVRDERYNGRVFVLVGDGDIVFPIDASYSNHSLELRASVSGRLVMVPDDSDMPWQPRFEVMIAKMDVATAALKRAIDEYDDVVRKRNADARRVELSEAKRLLVGE